MTRYLIKHTKWNFPRKTEFYWNGKNWGTKDEAAGYLTRHTAFDVMDLHCHAIGDWRPYEVQIDKVEVQ